MHLEWGSQPKSLGVCKTAQSCVISCNLTSTRCYHIPNDSRVQVTFLLNHCSFGLLHVVLKVKVEEIASPECK